MNLRGCQGLQNRDSSLEARRDCSSITNIRKSGFQLEMNLTTVLHLPYSLLYLQAGLKGEVPRDS